MNTSIWLILLAVAIPTLMIEMAGTSIFVAFETIASDLNVGMERSVWLTTLYLATNAMMIPLSGWLGKKIGYKRVIISGIIVFATGALLGAMARDFEALVASRALQGLGDGPIMPVTIALLFEIFPAHQRGKMMAGIMLGIGIAPALGPLLASWIVEEIGWRGIFYMNVIWAIISLVAVATLLPSMSPASENVKVSWPAFILLAIATGSLQLFLDRGEHYNWFNSPLILGLFVVFILSFIFYLLIVFLLKDNTVLDFKLLKDMPFLIGNFTYMLLMGTIYGSLIVKMLYLQWLMGFTPVYSGNYQAVFAGAMLLFSVIAGILTDKINPRWPAIFGLPVCVYALLLASRLSLASDLESIMTIGAIMGAGIAFVTVPISVAVFASVSRNDMGAASVLNSYLLVIGGSFSLALATTILMRRMDIHYFYLASVITPCNPAFIQAVHTTGYEIAMSAAYSQMTRQAAMFAFNDVWYLMAFVVVSLIIYLPFMKKS